MSSRAKCPRRLRHGRGLAGCFAVLVAAGPVAAAAEALPPPASAQAQSVAVSPPLCRADAFELGPFLDSLRVELAGRGLSCCTLVHASDGAPSAGRLLVRVEIDPCRADADRLQVSARAPVDSRAVEREIALGDVARTVRPRALALAVAELIRWLELGGTSTPEAVAVQAKPLLPSPTPPPSSVARPVERSLHLEAEARGLPTRDTLMWGGRVRFTAHRRPLHADLDLGGSYASARGELGEVLLRSASVGIGAGPRFATRTLIADLGLRAELGWAWIRGESASADVRTGAGGSPIASMGLRLSLQAPAQGRIRPSLTLEGGGVIRGVRAEVSGQPVAGMTGYYLLAALGMGVSL